MKRTISYLSSGVFFLLIAGGAATKYIYSVNRSLDSDDVLPYLYVHNMLVEKNLFLQGWFFATDPLLFIDLPFYLAVGAISGLDAFALKAVAFFIFMLGIASLALLIRRFWGVWPALCVTAYLLCEAPFATRILTKPYIHAGTIPFSIAALAATVFLLQRWRDGTWAKGRLAICAGAFTLALALMVFSDPLFAFMFVIPMVAACFVADVAKVELEKVRRELVFRISGSSFISWSVILFLGVASVILGLWLQRAASHFGLHFLFGMHAAYATFSVLIKNIGLYLAAIAELFDMNVLAAGLTPSAFIARCAKLALTLAALVAAPFLIAGERDRVMKLVMLYFFMVLLLLSGAYIASTQPVDLWTARFLTPVVYSVGFFVALGGLRLYRSRHTTAKYVVLGLFLFVCLHNGFETFRQGRGGFQQRLELARFLEQEGLSYGYSDYWSSNITTFLTEGRVPVRFVRYAHGLVVPFPELTNLGWYDPLYHTGPTFLMVPRAPLPMGGFELPQLTAAQLARNYGPPVRILAAHDMTIYIWPYNIMSILQKGRLVVDISTATPRTTGNFGGNGAGLSLYALPGQTGYLALGPYWPLPVGSYRVTWSLSIKGEKDAEAASIDVNVVDKNIVARPVGVAAHEAIMSPLNADWKDYSLEFRAGRNPSQYLLYEFRVFVTGRAEVKLKAVTIERL